MTEPVILVPLDGSRAALKALPVAKVFSDLAGAPVRVLNVAEQAKPLTELARELGASPAALGGASLECRAGQPAEVILRAAQEMPSRMIVLCTYSKAERPQDVLGRTALEVLRGAVAPVVLVNPELPLTGWRLRKVLLPHEGTPANSEAVRPGAELARRAGAELIVLLVAAPGAAAPQERGALTPPAYLDQPQHEWPAWAGEFMERLACVCPLADLRVRLLLGRGKPAAEILRVTRESAADLILLAWKGLWEPHRAETLKQVLREAPCPVMVTALPTGGQAAPDCASEATTSRGQGS